MSATTRTGAPVDPVVELRAVRYAEARSEETAHFSAAVYVDGRPFCYVRNDGRGGSDHFTPVAGGVEPRLLRGAVLAVARRVNPLAVDGDTPLVNDAGTLDEFALQFEGEWWRKGKRNAWHVFEALVDDALDNWMVARDLRRAFRTKMLFADEAGRVFYWQRGSRPDAELVQRIEALHPGAVILNTQPMAAAVRIMRRATFKV